MCPGGLVAPLYHYCSSASCTLRTVARRNQPVAYLQEPFVALHPAYSASCVSVGLDLPSDNDRIKAALPTARALKVVLYWCAGTTVVGRRVLAA